ncbi:MAG TPA: transposase, partial [Rhizomicrobium sp.]|nr:transposase [Rhizomicrobium sp.]
MTGAPRCRQARNPAHARDRRAQRTRRGQTGHSTTGRSLVGTRPTPVVSHCYDDRRCSPPRQSRGQARPAWSGVLADLDGAEHNSALLGKWIRGLLIRRSIADGGLAFFSTWSPRGAPIEELVQIEGCRWAIEDSFETAKNEFGLDHNESRSWHGWHRHVSLV